MDANGRKKLLEVEELVERVQREARLTDYEYEVLEKVLKLLNEL